MNPIFPIFQQTVIPSALPTFVGELSPQQQEIQINSNELLFLFATSQASKKGELTQERWEHAREKYHVQEFPNYCGPFLILSKEEWQRRLEETCRHGEALHKQQSASFVRYTPEDLASIARPETPSTLVTPSNADAIERLLSSAIMHDDVGMLIRLHNAGVSCAHTPVTGLFGKRCLPLYFAIDASKEYAFEFLMLIGAPVTQKEDPTNVLSSPIHFALHLQQWDKLRAMLEQLGRYFDRNISPERPDEENRLFLNIAIHDITAVRSDLKLLLKNPKYNINTIRPGLATLLTFACLTQNNKAVLKLLIESGADPFQEDGRRRSALQEVRFGTAEYRYLIRRRVTLRIQEISEPFLASIASEHIQPEATLASHQLTLILRQPLHSGTFKKIFTTCSDTIVLAKSPNSDREGSEKIPKEARFSHEIAALTPYALESFLVQYDGKSGEKLGLLMKRYPGSLSEHIKNMSLESKFNVATELVLALAVMHAHGYIHGDLKSDNILVRQETNGIYTIKLCDFGSTTKEGEITSHVQTMPPPEVFEAEQTRQLLVATPAIDLWALSDLLFSLLMSVSSRSLFRTNEVWYDRHTKPGSELHFISRAQKTSDELKDRARISSSPLHKVIANLASLAPSKRPPALHVLAHIRTTADSLHFEKIVEKTDAELRRIEALLPQMNDETRQQEALAHLTFVYATFDQEKALQLALRIKDHDSRDDQLKLIINTCIQREKLDCIKSAAIHIHDPDKKTEALYDLLQQYLNIPDCENAYTIVDLFLNQEDKERALQLILEEATSPENRDLTFTRHVDELCKRNVVTIAQRLIPLISNPHCQEQAMTILVQKMIKSNDMENAQAYVMAIAEIPLQAQVITSIVEQLDSEKKFEEAHGFAILVKDDKQRMLLLHNIAQK